MERSSPADLSENPPSICQTAARLANETPDVWAAFSNLAVPSAKRAT